MSSKMLTVNVGGTEFKVTYDSLLKHDGFVAQLNKLSIKIEPNYIFINRDSKYFKQILQFLQTGTITDKSLEFLRQLTIF